MSRSQKFLRNVMPPAPTREEAADLVSLDLFGQQRRRQQTLAAYRSLLRAITYTPDPVAREFLHETARTRFRSTTALKQIEKRDKKYNERIKKARSLMHRIERANRGVVEDVVKVLDLAYGRTGPRRRFLIRDLLEAEEQDLPQDDRALSSLISGEAAKISQNVVKINTTKKFDAFLRSQLARPASDQRGQPSFKGPNPTIPKNNLWGRPMPKSRKVNTLQKWWAEALEKLNPPVPHQTWDLLRDLTTGVVRIPELILPRSSPEHAEKLLVLDDRLLVNNLRNPAREKRELEWRADHRKIYVAPKITESDEKTLVTAYNFPRTMRRIYGQIWARTPKMYKELDTEKWLVEWGHEKSQILQNPVAVLSADQLELFEGTDGTNVSKTSSRRRSGRADKPMPDKSIPDESIPDESIPKERRLAKWNPRTLFWNPPPEPDPPMNLEESEDKSAEEKKGIPEEYIMRLALRQKELLKSKAGRGIMRTLPTRKELKEEKP